MTAPPMPDSAPIRNRWGDIDGENITFNLTLSVSDGINTGSKTILVHVNNRVPVQIYAETMTTMTYTSLVLPDVFIDDDGVLVSHDWTFPDGVRVGAGTPVRTDDFSTVSSTVENPIVAWDTPGNKTVTLLVTDDDGSQATAVLNVVVLNQLPVATFDVRTLSSLGSKEIDFREEDGEVDTAYVFDGLDSVDPDGLVGDSSDIEVWNWTFSDGTFGDRPQATHTFATPGIHTVTLVVTDKSGEQSFPRTMTVRIANPLPVIEVRILDGWIDGDLITTSTVFPEGSTPDAWSHTFNEEGAVVTAPQRLLYFDSSGTRDGDRQFEGRYIRLKPPRQIGTDWCNTRGTSAMRPRSFTNPARGMLTPCGQAGFADGSRWFWYRRCGRNLHRRGRSSPEAREIYVPESIFSGSSTSFDADVFDAESGSDVEIYRDLDVEDGSITERDERILTELSVRWDFDIETDDYENGDPADDWLTPVPGSTVRTITRGRCGLTPFLLRFVTVWVNAPAHRRHRGR